jgi:hypothetical protein
MRAFLTTPRQLQRPLASSFAGRALAAVRALPSAAPPLLPGPRSQPAACSQQAWQRLVPYISAGCLAGHCAGVAGLQRPQRQGCTGPCTCTVAKRCCAKRSASCAAACAAAASASASALASVAARSPARSSASCASSCCVCAAACAASSLRVTWRPRGAVQGAVCPAGLPACVELLGSAPHRAGRCAAPAPAAHAAPCPAWPAAGWAKAGTREPWWGLPL